MTVGAVLVALWAIGGALSCALFLYGAIMLARRCPQLASLDPPTPASWPALSVVIAARDEEQTIASGLRSLLAEGYPALEIVVVDDRSTDRTGEVIERLAGSDARVVPMHLRDLPAGWLGKVHALQRGLERTRGEFVLFTDADVEFAPGALRRAIAWAEADQLDHVAVLTQVRPGSFWAAICMASALRGVLGLTRAWEAADPRSARAIGNGAFNLVRRTAFERTPGFEWLRLEVADDIGLGLMMKRGGGRPGLALGRGQVTHPAYPTFAAAVRGLEKNAFAQGARFSLARGLALFVLAVIGAFGPFAGFLPVGVPWLPAVSVVALSSFVAASLIAARSFGGPIGYVLASLPLGDLLMAWIIARATVLGVRRGGLVWRGTTYPTELLRTAQRVEM